MPTTDPLTLRYDAACPVRAVEIDPLRERNTEGRLVLINAAGPTFDPRPDSDTPAATSSRSMTPLALLMLMLMLLLACALQPHLLYAQAASTSSYGTVTRVSDGDTVWVRPETLGPGGAQAKPFKLRLQGIDAPERCQAWGPQAQAALSAKVLHQRVQWQTRERDDYERNLGNIWLAGEDVSAWLVSNGYAWSYRYRRSAGPYVAQEEAARQSRRGLFADPQALPPRQFRKLNGPCP